VLNIKIARWLSLFATVSAAFQGVAHAQPWGEIDELKEFVTRDQVVTNARLMETGRLMESGLPETPWSSDFWPDMKGSIADPYNETGQGPLGIPINRIMLSANLSNLKSRASLHQQAVQNINSIDETKFDNMSPTEKYDMLLGDPNFTMTNQVIKMVEVEDSIGIVAPFSGVCHGWSPASLYMPRPEHKITLMSPFGRPVNFYPFDIKALATFLWGKTPAANMVHFQGNKCYSGGHVTKYGRLVDPKCFNANPAMFHLVLVNQLGLNHRGFIVDRKDDSSVWNHPVYAYRSKFFKVTDRKPTPGVSFDEAKVLASGLQFDPYREFRSPKTSSIVGVETTFWYGVENKNPDHTPTDDPSKDHTDHQTIRYDLELDVNDNIVGGEWREYDEADAQTLFEQVGWTHPNTIWLVPPGLSAFSPGDVYADGTSWDGSGTVPAAWRDAAVKYASSATIGVDDPKTGKLVTVPNPQALGQIVNLLIELSRK
jgi:hypothetical protein